jgi:hypothetical protein
MSFPPPRTSDKSNRAYKKSDKEVSTRESELLLEGNARTTSTVENQGILRNLSEASRGFIRARKSSKSPVQIQPNQHFSTQQQQHCKESDPPMQRVTSGDMESDEHDGYEAVEDAAVNSSQSQHSAMDDAGSQSTHLYSQHSNSASSRPSVPTQGGGGGGGSTYREAPSGDDYSLGSGGEQPPLMEIPEEIYAVRKAALQVLKPLTKTWVSRSEARIPQCSSLGLPLLTLLFDFSPCFFALHVTDCCFGRIRAHCPLWNDTMDTPTTRNTLLVHFAPVLVNTYWAFMAARLVGACTLFLYCRRQRQPTAGGLT